MAALRSVNVLTTAAGQLALHGGTNYMRRDVKITPYASGTLDYPGLPQDSMTSEYDQKYMPIRSEEWRKIVIKIYPPQQHFTYSKGYRLNLGTGTTGDAAPQSGWMAQTESHGTFTPLAIPTDGKIEILATDTNLYPQLTSPQGLVLFIKRDATVDQAHLLSLDILPKVEGNSEERLGALNLLPVEVVVDTNRDGIVSLASDQVGKDQWTDQRGAIYGVNFDRDGDLNHSSKPVADAITWWDTEGVPIHEDWKINGQSDESDITPLVITIPNLPDGSKVYLVAGEAEDVRAIHLFPRIKVDKQAIWGGFLDAGKPWTDNDSTPLDMEISQWLNASADDPASTETGIKEGTYTFGIEGLLFRGMTVPGGTFPGNIDKFSGIIDLELELQLPGSNARLKCGKVRLKVAPFLLARNGLPTTHIYTASESSSSSVSLLSGMPQEKVVQSGRPDESIWMQDHVEIGYTQRPGTDTPMKIAFVCPYRDNQKPQNPILADWPRTKISGVDSGFFSLGKTLGQLSAGNYGGNIEVTNPNVDHPLGRILAGSKMTDQLKAFFSAQEKQNLSIIDVDYAAVQHIDEVISIGPSAYYKADPAAGITLLEEKFTTEQSQLEGVIFSKDAKRAKVASTFATTPDPYGPEDSSKFYVITNLDYESNFDDWKDYKYLRIVSISGNNIGPSNGQVAWISGIVKAVDTDAPGEVNVAGKMKILVNRVCWSTVGTDWALPGSESKTTHWFIPPQKDDSLIAVKDTLFWQNKWNDQVTKVVEYGRPAFITVKEVLNNAKIKTYNASTLPSLIAKSVEAAGILNPIGLPSIYHESIYQDIKGNDRPSFANAFIPAAINLQWTDKGVAAVPKQYGPRSSDDKDVFEEKLLEILGAGTVFLIDWQDYHLNFGELHCGSAAERVAEPSWWSK